jgi:hypothetical protein
MKVMAAMLSTRAGERDTAWYMWQRIYESSDDATIRENALRRLLALRVDQEVENLQKLVDRYKQQTGKLPESWRAMEMSGYLRSIPQDPTGLPYDLSASGRVLVHDPDRIPFIQEGLPEGQTSKNVVLPKKAVKVTPDEVLKKEPRRK